MVNIWLKNNKCADIASFNEMRFQRLGLTWDTVWPISTGVIFWVEWPQIILNYG